MRRLATAALAEHKIRASRNMISPFYRIRKQLGRDIAFVHRMRLGEMERYIGRARASGGLLVPRAFMKRRTTASHSHSRRTVRIFTLRLLYVFSGT